MLTIRRSLLFNIEENPMNIHRTLLTAALLTTFAIGAPASAAPASATPASHQFAPARSGAPTKLMLDHGKKWATDEPLRRNMSEIRTALVAKATAIHHATLTADDYKALGSLVEAHVAKIVTECKLDPAADENLHLIVAELSYRRRRHAGQVESHAGCRSSADGRRGESVRPLLPAPGVETNRLIRLASKQ
jgi:hypothetical protein